MKRALFLLLVVILFLTACEVTPEQAESWRIMSQGLYETAENLDNKYIYHAPTQPDKYYSDEEERYYRRLNREAWEKKYSTPVEVEPVRIQ